MNEMPIPAVILAGGNCGDEMAQASGETRKSLVPLNGLPMLDWVIDAIEKSGAISRMIVVGTKDRWQYKRENAPAPISVIQNDEGFVGNLFAGFGQVTETSRVLVSTADIPFINPEVVCDFVREALDLEADMVYPIVPMELCAQRFPGMKRTALRLKEGNFTGGNMVLLRPHFLQQNRDRIAQAYSARKSPLRLGMMIGFQTVVRFLLSQLLSPNLLSVAKLEGEISRLIGGRACALICKRPEIATDVDRPADLLVAQSLLAGPKEP